MEVFPMRLFFKTWNKLTPVKKRFIHRALFTFSFSLFIPLSGFSYSQTSYYCANTNSYVNLGDSIDQVTQNCGEPTQTKMDNSVTSASLPVEQWSYQAPFVVTAGKVQYVSRPNFRIPLIINFSDNKVVRIYDQENEAKESYFCNPLVPVKIGDTKEDVRNLCSNPTLVENTSQQSKKKVTPQLIYIYQPNSYDRLVSMYFENFKLVKIETE